MLFQLERILCWFVEREAPIQFDSFFESKSYQISKGHKVGILQNDRICPVQMKQTFGSHGDKLKFDFPKDKNWGKANFLVGTDGKQIFLDGSWNFHGGDFENCSLGQEISISKNDIARVCPSSIF